MSRFGTGERSQSQNIAQAVTEVSEQALQLVHEEIELAKAEVGNKLARLMRGTAVAAAAGSFVAGAMMLILIGLSLLAWWLLPVGPTEYFWGFFFVAGVLLVLAVLAGLAAWKVVRVDPSPMPTVAIGEARKIKEAVSAVPGAEAPAAGGVAAAVAPGEVPTWGAGAASETGGKPAAKEG